MEITNNKVLSLKSVALLTFLSNFGVRWLIFAAALGASSSSFWIVSALIFFIPLTCAVAHLSKLYPEEGGVYIWTKNVLGEKHGFIVAWLYFINNIFYYPALLIFLATNLAYFLDYPQLAQESVFIIPVILVTFWGVVITSLYGFKANKKLTEYAGTLGTIIPLILLIILSLIYFIFFKKSATPFSVHAVFSIGHLATHLSTLTVIMFAMSGIEIIPTFANSIKNPKKNLYRGIFIGAVVIVLSYILGTIALNILLNPAQIHNTSGLLQAFVVIGKNLHFDFIARLMAFLFVFTELATLSIWLLAPITIFFKCTPEGILPKWLHKTNKHNAPAAALILVGCLVTIVVITTNLLPSINTMYQALILMAAVLSFIPYLYLSVVYIKSFKLNNKVNKKIWPVILTLCILFSTILGIVFSFVPPDNLKHSSVFLYEIELVVCTFVVLALGYLIYKLRRPLKSF